MNKIWSDDAWEDYLYWQSQDKKTLKRINQLIRDIERNGCKENSRQNVLAGICFRACSHKWKMGANGEACPKNTEIGT